jgi:hypothetical protein
VRVAESAVHNEVFRNKHLIYDIIAGALGHPPKRTTLHSIQHEAVKLVHSGHTVEDAVSGAMVGYIATSKVLDENSRFLQRINNVKPVIVHTSALTQTEIQTAPDGHILRMTIKEKKPRSLVRFWRT